MVGSTAKHHTMGDDSMKKLLLIIICLLLSGCGGNFQKILRENIPEGGFTKFKMVENIAPSVAITIDAEGAERDGDTIKIDSLKYDRKAGTSSAYIEVEGLIMEVPEE